MAYRNYRRRRKGFFKRMSLNNLLILINVVVFVVLFPFLVSGFGDTVINYVALNPELFFQGFVWTLLTSMFMHGGFGHLFVNMVSMFFIGGLVERLIGKKRYLWFYFSAGIIAGLFFVVLAFVGQFVPGGERIFGGFDAFAVGASGALFGLGGLLAVLIPRLKVLVFFILPMPMWLAMAVLMFGLWAISIASSLPIGNTAHFGGLVVGVVYGFYLRKRYSKKVRMLNKMFG
jgi:membrane associated rhomboid family serine protease